MKFEDIPKEIAESDLVGEMIAWNLINILVEEVPESSSKRDMLDLIDKRMHQIMTMEL